MASTAQTEQPVSLDSKSVDLASSASTSLFGAETSAQSSSDLLSSTAPSPGTVIHVRPKPKRIVSQTERNILRARLQKAREAKRAKRDACDDELVRIFMAEVPPVAGLPAHVESAPDAGSMQCDSDDRDATPLVSNLPESRPVLPSIPEVDECDFDEHTDYAPTRSPGLEANRVSSGLLRPRAGQDPSVSAPIHKTTPPADRSQPLPPLRHPRDLEHVRATSARLMASQPRFVSAGGVAGSTPAGDAVARSNESGSFLKTSLALLVIATVSYYSWRYGKEYLESLFLTSTAGAPMETHAESFGLSQTFVGNTTQTLQSNPQNRKKAPVFLDSRAYRTPEPRASSSSSSSETPSVTD